MHHVHVLVPANYMYIYNVHVHVRVHVHVYSQMHCTCTCIWIQAGLEIVCRPKGPATLKKGWTIEPGSLIFRRPDSNLAGRRIFPTLIQGFICRMFHIRNASSTFKNIYTCMPCTCTCTHVQCMYMYMYLLAELCVPV